MGRCSGRLGAFAMDGSVTPRAEMAGKVAKWANAHAEVWKSHPVKGDVGLVFVPESELFNYVQQGGTEYYAQSIRGAYQAFFDQNILADFVALENIDEYKLVYLAYPVMLKQETAERLKEYVRKGGTLDLRRAAGVLRRPRTRGDGAAKFRAGCVVWRAREVCRVRSGPVGAVDV